MSEMLANRYFLSGRFADAVELFEDVLRQRPDRVAARQRLIFSYVMAGRLEDAVRSAVRVARQDPHLLIDPDEGDQGLPCRHLLLSYRRREESLDPARFRAGMGVIQLSCDPERALIEIEKALSYGPVCDGLGELRDYLKQELRAGQV
jgi:hypothetical protein